MEALCARRHQWSLVTNAGGVSSEARRGLPSCPACGGSAEVVERVGGLQIDFSLPRDVRPASSVLLVDGNERRREALAEQLGAAELPVVGHAADGTDALELAALLRPDAVVLAHRMPRLDGFTSLPLLRSAAPEAVIVYHAPGLALDRIAAACQRGADACMGEEAVLEAVVPTLERLLGRVPVNSRNSGDPGVATTAA